MANTKEPLIRDLVQWCAYETRSYDDVLNAWRTSCPRLTVWEDAVERGLLETRPSARGLQVAVTDAGHRLLTAHSAPDRRGLPVGPVMATARPR